MDLVAFVVAQHAAFRLSAWPTVDGVCLLLVEHLHTGERTALPTLEAATGWIVARLTASRVTSEASVPEAGAAPGAD